MASLCFQKLDFCLRFHINSTLLADCHGTYKYAGRDCGSFPVYVKSDGSPFKVIMRYLLQPKWTCSDKLPGPQYCFTNFWVASPRRWNVEGHWKDDAWATCLEYSKFT